MSLIRRWHAFLLGMVEFRHDLTTGFVGGDDLSEFEWYAVYDRGRDLAHRLTRRRYDLCGDHGAHEPPTYPISNVRVIP